MEKDKLKKALYVFPSLVTLTGAFLGFFSIIISATAEGPQDFLRAGTAIILAMICDIFDGRVARMTKTQSDFGIQIDSLADIVSFGVAPAVLVYQWGLSELGRFGFVAAGIFMIAGALRLARFNVLASRGLTSGTYYLGLPIPSGAGMLASLVILHSRSGIEHVRFPLQVLIFVVILSYLMVSNIRYRSFKHVKPTPRALAIAFSVLAVAWYLAIKFTPPFLLVSLFSAYISLGLVEEFLQFSSSKAKEFKRRRKIAIEENEPIEIEPDDLPLSEEDEEDEDKEEVRKDNIF